MAKCMGQALLLPEDMKRLEEWDDKGLLLNMKSKLLFLFTKKKKNFYCFLLLILCFVRLPMSNCGTSQVPSNQRKAKGGLEG